MILVFCLMSFDFRITKRDIGMFVTFEVVDLGVVIQWDKGNRLYIRLQPNWKGHTSGLCGNFNLDSSDDFQTPSGILEASPEIFGDSWKLHRYCPKAAIIHVRILFFKDNMNNKLFRTPAQFIHTGSSGQQKNVAF